ncbi:hypothetical protein HYW32_00345 [Candidatus Berkelbacteria bacterium]|nr:hypothetical protein [Candidatus Berkelbacteria bacterium]
MKPKKHRPKKGTGAVDELSGTLQREGSWLAWEAPEFVYFEKSWLWVVGLLAVAAFFIIVFYFMRDYSAMLVVALAAVVFYQQSRQKPVMVRYSIDEHGFKAGEKFYDWDQLKSFWITAKAGNPHLYLETTLKFLPVRTIHLAHVEPVELRARLRNHLPEQMTRGEIFTDRLMRWLKF